MALVQSKVIELSPGNSSSVTLDSAVTAGNALVVLGSCYNDAGTATMAVSSTIGGSAANTWATVQNAQNGVASAHAAYANNASAGTTVVTVTINGSTGNRYLSAVVCEFSGVTTSAYDVSASNNGNSTAVTTGTTAAKAQNNETVIVVVGESTGGLMSAIGGFTTIYLQPSAATYEPIYTAYKSVNASGTESASMTLGSASTWAAAILTLRESGGGGGPAADAYLTMPPLAPPRR